MIEVYNLLNQALIEGKWYTKGGYHVSSLKFTTAVQVALSHPIKQGLVVIVTNGKGLRIEVDIKAPDGRSITGSYPHAKMAAESVLNL